MRGALRPNEIVDVPGDPLASSAIEMFRRGDRHAQLVGRVQQTFAQPEKGGGFPKNERIGQGDLEGLLHKASDGLQIRIGYAEHGELARLGKTFDEIHAGRENDIGNNPRPRFDNVRQWPPMCQPEKRTLDRVPVHAGR
ncbi:hypothetical protein D3C87_1658580 [compost metagenome]